MELTLVEDQTRVEVALSKSRSDQLRLSAGEAVYVRSSDIKVFEGDYSI